MRSFIEFVVRTKDYITLSALIVICFAMMTYGNVAQLGGFRTVVVGGIGWIQNVFSWVPNPVALKSENRALRELNLQLSTEAAKMRHAMLENEKLRKMLAFKEPTNTPIVPAEVVGKTTVQLRNFITINRGAKDGIKPGMVAKTDAGLVGTVVSASENFALIQLIIDRDARIAARIERTGIDGIVAWEGEENLIIKNIPKSYDVQAGDLLVTSNYSNKYPAGIPVGRVTEVRDEANSLFRRIIITPSVGFSSLEQLYVVLYIPNPERARLEQEMEARVMESIRARTTRRER
ncbi:MAG TPA: rod shape-determining protein MreC [Patescibacteria group bacterium]|nr:rod shape-determining protein MreC [Patescibacteria group bacterium]